MNSSNKNTVKNVKTHHFLRTPLAALCGIIAVNLILGSILVLWLNRTLTNTPTFVNTVSPLVQKPEVQQFIAKQAAEGIVNSAPVQDISSKFLTDKQRTGKNAEQLKTAVQSEVETRVLKVIATPQFAKTWRDGLQSAHSQLVTQLDSGSENITFDFSPIVTEAVDQLAQSDLGINPKEINLGKDTGKVSLKRSDMGPAVQAYDNIKKASILLAIAAVAFAAAAIVLSVHHMKTLRRILIATAVFAVLFFIILNAPSYVKTTGIDPVEQAAVTTIIASLFAKLKLALLVVAVTCVAVAVGSKLYESVAKKRAVAS